MVNESLGEDFSRHHDWPPAACFPWDRERESWIGRKEKGRSINTTKYNFTMPSIAIHMHQACGKGSFIIRNISPGLVTHANEVYFAWIRSVFIKCLSRNSGESELPWVICSDVVEMTHVRCCYSDTDGWERRWKLPCQLPQDWRPTPSHHPYFKPCK